MYRGKVMRLAHPPIKSSLGEGKPLHLESPDLFGALTTLEGKPGIVDVAVFGGGLHVKVEDGARNSRNSCRASVRGVGIDTIEPIRPSMEERLCQPDRTGREGRRMNLRRTRAVAHEELLQSFAIPARSTAALRSSALDAAHLRLRLKPGRGSYPHGGLRSGSYAAEPGLDSRL